MKEIGGFFARLTSRKFLLTLFGIVAVTLYPEGQTAIVTLIATFVGAEGIADTVSRYSVEKTKQADITATSTSTATTTTPLSELDDIDDVDTAGTIIPGDVPL